MHKMNALVNRALVLYILSVGIFMFFIDFTQVSLKVLNFQRNDARYVNRFAIQPGVEYNPKKFYSAAKYHRGLVRLLPDQTWSHGVLGYIYVQQGKWQAAARAYEKAVQEHPDLFGFHFNLGLVYYQLGDYQQAKDALEHAIKASPATSLAHHRGIAKRLFPKKVLQDRWIQEKIYRLKSAHTFATQVHEHIDTSKPMVIDLAQYYYYVPPLETGVIPLKAVVEGYQIP